MEKWLNGEKLVKWKNWLTEKMVKWKNWLNRKIG